MKKGIFLMILFVFLTGCTKNEKKMPVPKPPAESDSRPPENPKKQEQPAESVIGSYETPINDRSQGREENIALCVKTINGTTIDPGKTFSFNAAAGPRTEERGYKKAKVMIDGEYVMDFGGGVCQVSTTLYNAAAAAGLEITERHSHKKPVSYVNKGQDAAVNYNDLDLKFANNSGGIIRLDITQDGKKIAVNIVKIE